MNNKIKYLSILVIIAGFTGLNSMNKFENTASTSSTSSTSSSSSSSRFQTSESTYNHDELLPFAVYETLPDSSITKILAVHFMINQYMKTDPTNDAHLQDVKKNLFEKFNTLNFLEQFVLIAYFGDEGNLLHKAIVNKKPWLVDIILQWSALMVGYQYTNKNEIGIITYMQTIPYMAKDTEKGLKSSIDLACEMGMVKAYQLLQAYILANLGNDYESDMHAGRSVGQRSSLSSVARHIVLSSLDDTATPLSLSEIKNLYNNDSDFPA